MNRFDDRSAASKRKVQTPRPFARVTVRRGGRINLTVEIPDDIASRLSAAEPELSRRALEAFGLEEHKASRLAEYELQRLLGFGTRYQLDGFLKAHNVSVDYTIEDTRREQESFRRLGI